MPVRALRGVGPGKGALARNARRHVGPQGCGRRVRKRREDLVRHASERLEVLDDSGQLAGETVVLPVPEVERGEPRHPADQLAVDPHADEYSQRLDGPGPLPYRRALP